MFILDTVGGRLLLFLVVLGLIVAAIIKAHTSRLVQAGLAILVVTAGLLWLGPSLATGLLFWFSIPLGLVMIVVGTILSFVPRGSAIREDVAALAAAARRTDCLWPHEPPLPEIDDVARHGTAAGPALVELLRFDSEARLDDLTWSTTVEQQVALALCRIYAETPSGGKTIYDLRATASENAQVKQFWEMRVLTFANVPGPPGPG